MAALVFGMIGAAIAPVGYAALGYTIGAALGGSLFGPKPPSSHLSAPRLEDIQFTGINYGQYIPYLDGTDRVAGHVLWVSAMRSIPHNQTQESGGKGGGGSSSSYTSYTYEADVILSLSHHGDGDLPVGVSKFWYNNKLYYNISSDASEETLRASHNSKKWTRFSFYDGNASQLPDPDYEAAVTDAPAYRGLATVFIKNFQLGESNQLGNFQFEVVRQGSTYVQTPTALIYPQDNSGSIVSMLHDSISNRAVTLTSQSYWSGLKVRIINIDGGVNVFDFDASVSATINTGHHVAWIHDERLYVFGEYWLFNNAIHEFVISGTPFYIGTYHIVDYVYGNMRSGSCWCEYNFSLYNIFGGNLVKIQKDVSLQWVKVAEYVIPHAGSDFTLTACGKYIVFLCPSAYGNSLMIFDTDTGQFTYNGNPFTVPTSTISTKWISEKSKLLFCTEWNNTVDFIDPYSQSFGNIFTGDVFYFDYDSDINKYVIGHRFSSSGWKDYVRLLNADNYSTDIDFVYDSTEFGTMKSSMSVGGAVLTIDPNELKYLRYGGNVIYPYQQDIESCVDRIMQYCKVDAAHYDTTQLTPITKQVYGFHSTDQTSGRALIEQLMTTHNFGAYCADKIYFYQLASSPVRTFDYGDLGAGLDAAEENPFALEQNTDIERGARYSVTYPCASNAYNADTRSTDRRVTVVDNTTEARDFAVVMTPAQAQGVADTLALTAQSGRYSASISVFGEHDDLTAGDVVSVTDNVGRVHRMRVMSTTHSWPIVRLSLVMDDANAIRETGITDDDFNVDDSLVPTANTVLELLDIPLISDVYETSGIGYGVAAYGDTSNWAGCGVFQSHNDTSYSQITTIGEVAAIGEATSVLHVGIDNGALDTMSFVTFTVNKAVTGTPYDDILDSATAGLWLFGSELCQVINLEFVSAGVYKAHGMLRGRFGTEWAMSTHSVGERVVKIQESGMRFKDMPVSRLNQSMFYKGVSFEQSIGDVTPINFANTGVCKKPLSPVHAVASKSGNDIVVDFQRRSRLESRLIDGNYLPIGEDSELYEIDVFDGAAVINTYIATTTTWTYLEADQVADFGGTQNSIKVKIYQISAIVGRGYPLEYQSGTL